jgi:hypothetical protein
MSYKKFVIFRLNWQMELGKKIILIFGFSIFGSAVKVEKLIYNR